MSGIGELDGRPFCECGNCDSTGRNGKNEIRLPMEAWAVAGSGDPERIAVRPDHGRTLVEEIEHLGGSATVERHRGWWAISGDDVGDSE